MDGSMETAACFTNEEIRSIVEDDVVDPEAEENLRTLQSDVSKALQDMAEFPLLSQLDWADGLEDSARTVAQEMAQAVEDYTHGAAVFEGRAGEDALVAPALRCQVSWCDARRAESEALVASVRRLRDRYLRTIAGTDQELELIGAAASEFLEFVAGEMDGGVAPHAESAAEEARAEVMDAAARAGQGVGARFAERFVDLAAMLRRGAMSYEGVGEDEALVEGLRRRAGEVEALCADPETLVERMLVSGTWRFWRYLNRHGRALLSSMPSTATAKPPL